MSLLVRGPLHDPITLRRPHLLIASLCGLGFQYTCGGVKISSQLQVSYLFENLTSKLKFEELIASHLKIINVEPGE